MAERVDTIQKYLPVRDPDACWVWLGQRNADGYGRVYRDGRRHLAHRYMYEMERGPIPAGMVLRHTCDNPPCCNPKHLVPGTDADNVADMIAAGRQAKGTRQHCAKMTDELVAEARKLYRSGAMSGRTIAKRYGLAQSSMARVLRGDSWQHVPMEES